MIRTYYASDFAAQVAKPPWDLASNLPKIVAPSATTPVRVTAFPASGDSTTSYLDASDPGTWGPVFFQYTLDLLSSQTPAWLQDATAGFFVLNSSSGASRDTLNIGNIVRDSLVCNFDNVMFCCRQGDGTAQRQRRNLLVCFVVAVVFWLAMGALVSYIPGSLGTMLQVGMIDILLHIDSHTSMFSAFKLTCMLQISIYVGMLVLVPATTVQLSYGVAATCFPMVPTCLLQDLILSAQSTLPVTIRWPDSLQRESGCMDRLTNASSERRQQACMKSCRESPFHFRRWEASSECVFWLCLNAHVHILLYV